MIKSEMEVSLIDHMGNDSSVVRAARVSFAGDNKEFDELKDAKLIHYLAKHKHFSPFHHTFITVKVKAPIFVCRQLVKHKFMPWNEESRRYINSEPEFYFPSEYRKSAENVKQGSSDETVNKEILWGEDDESYDEHGSVQHALNYYNWLLMKGVCNEQARMFLPQNMMVNYYWSGTLSAFAEMLRLRLDSHTQKESREIAQKIRDVVEPLFPVSLPALLGE